MEHNARHSVGSRTFKDNKKQREASGDERLAQGTVKSLYTNNVYYSINTPFQALCKQYIFEVVYKLFTHVIVTNPLIKAKALISMIMNVSPGFA